jgi:hypothetical protein
MANLLKSLYEEMYGPLDSPGKMTHLTELGQLLAGMVGRKRHFTAHHLNAVIMQYKGFIITPELETAIEALGAKRDGANPIKPRLVEVTVYSVNGSVEPGSIITGTSTRCPGCLVLFVPHNNFQIYCGPECPGRPAKRKAKAGL